MCIATPNPYVPKVPVATGVQNTCVNISEKEKTMIQKNTVAAVWEQHKKVIPGGVVSLNRVIDPMRVFVKAEGAYLWDSDGRQYIDYHAAFSPYLLGHSDPDVDGAVIQAIKDGKSLIGAGTTPWEGELANLLVECIPTLDQVQITNTGSEATFFAVRVARDNNRTRRSDYHAGRVQRLAQRCRFQFDGST